MRYLWHYMMLALEGDKETVKKIIQENPGDYDEVSAYSFGNIKAMHGAAEYGYIEIVEMLVHAGFDPLVKDSKGCIPLDYARSMCRQEVIEFLQKFKKPVMDAFLQRERSAEQISYELHKITQPSDLIRWLKYFLEQRTIASDLIDLSRNPDPRRFFAQYFGREPVPGELEPQLMEKLGKIAFVCMNSIGASLCFIARYTDSESYMFCDEQDRQLLSTFKSPLSVYGDLPAGTIQDYKHGLYIASASIGDMPIMTFFVIPGPNKSFQCHKYIFKCLQAIVATATRREVVLSWLKGISSKLHADALRKIGTKCIMTRPWFEMKNIMLTKGGVEVLPEQEQQKLTELVGMDGYEYFMRQASPEMKANVVYLSSDCLFRTMSEEKEFQESQAAGSLQSSTPKSTPPVYVSDRTTVSTSDAEPPSPMPCDMHAEQHMQITRSPMQIFPFFSKAYPEFGEESLIGSAATFLGRCNIL